MSAANLFGVVPARFTHPDWAARVGFPLDDYWPFLTSMFPQPVKHQPTVEYLPIPRHGDRHSGKHSSAGGA